MSEKIWHLKNCDLFERLSPDELATLEQSALARKFPRGGLVYLPRDAGDSVLLLASGRVKITNVTGEGKQAIVNCSASWQLSTVASGTSLPRRCRLRP